MAKLQTYVVTANVTQDEIKKEIVNRLNMYEELNKDEQAFSLTFDNPRKKIYMIYSDSMVANDKKLTESLVEVQPDLSDLNKQISDINAKIDIITKHLKLDEKPNQGGSIW